MSCLGAADWGVPSRSMSIVPFADENPILSTRQPRHRTRPSCARPRPVVGRGLTVRRVAAGATAARKTRRSADCDRRRWASRRQRGSDTPRRGLHGPSHARRPRARDPFGRPPYPRLTSARRRSSTGGTSGLQLGMTSTMSSGSSPASARWMWPPAWSCSTQAKSSGIRRS